jgi:hypothetical protein
MSGSRASTARQTGALAPADRSSVASSGGVTPNVGAVAAATWLRTRGLTAPTMQRWHVEIALGVLHRRPPTDFDDTTATRFHIDIYMEEWGVYFCHAGRASWIRVTDIAFVHGRDDFQLLGCTPPLKEVGTLLRRVEQAHGLCFERQHAAIRTNLMNIEPAIRSWIASL